MAYVIAEPCIGVKDTACVDACPVDCIHPKKDDPKFETEDDDLHRSGGVHRLRRLRAGMPGLGDLRASTICRRSGPTSRPRTRSTSGDKKIAGRSCPTSEELAQNGVRCETVPDSTGGARRTLCAFKELARTTEPDSAESSGVPDSLEGRAGPVRASEELAQNGVRRETVPDRLVVRAAPFALSSWRNTAPRRVPARPWS